ncbi:CehA/McbA family metallohydrolase [Thermosipho ferrireducens]|uniref:CehA/McbA family metallohydrolase n=1 Tax=Thermosipho ferrireducens TaxID=2571116 RepID=A0ABX7S6C2_9BACT|nr:DUF4350 domain-containing protein [Thermosipho ferrireducens]QTA38126.1 CehA/McbA family metallohydrolase [Thermosipho ferrireducens]
MVKKLFIIFIAVISVVSFAGIYYGNLHAHTTYSDGSKTPEYAYNYAKNFVDVQAITDHAYYFTQLIDGKTKPYLTKLAAASATVPGEFVALQGFEWTSGIGHINVYESTKWLSRAQDDSLEGFYSWLAKNRKLAQFNHPIKTFGNFRDFEYFPEADKYVNLIEVGNGNWALGDVISPEMFKNYILALNNGWHLGATVGQDNHKPNWGSANDSRVGIIADTLSYDDIMNALWNRHTFGTEDKNVKIDFSYKHYIMGDIVYNPPKKVVLSFNYEDENDPMSYFALISQSGTVVEDYPDVSNYATRIEVELPDGYEWFFVYVRQNDSQEIITAPIWFQNESSVYVNNIRINQQKLFVGDDAGIFFDVYNVTDKPVKINLEVVDNETIISNKTLSFGPYEVKKSSVKLYNLSQGMHKIKFTINGVSVQSIVLLVNEKVGKTVMIDTLHENDYIDELKQLAPLMEKSGYNVIYPKKMLTKLSKVDILIIPTPKKDGFDFAKDLLPPELNALNSFKGEIILIPGSDEVYKKLYLEKIKGNVNVMDFAELPEYFNLPEVKKTDTVIIDVGHFNDYTQDKLTKLENYLKSKGLKVVYVQKLENLKADVLIISNGKDFSEVEIQNIVKFVQNGGKLIISGKSDFRNGGNTKDLNEILSALKAPFKFNDDQVIDATNNYGAPYKVLANDVRFYSPCSIIVSGDAQILIESFTAKSEDKDGNGDAVPVSRIILAAKSNIGNGVVIALGKAVFSDYDFDYNKEFIANIFDY